MWPTMVALARLRRDRGPDQAPPRPGRAPPGAGAPRGVPLGRRVALGRVVRTGRTTASRSGDGRPTRATSPPPTSTTAPALAAPHRPAARPRRRGAPRSTSSPPARWTRGGPSTSTTTARSRPDTQANHVRALAFDLVPDELRARTADRLVELIREAGTHLGTGFLATPHPPPGARRRRPPRRRLRAAAAGHAAVVAGDGRPRRHHRVGGRGRASTPTAWPTTRSTTTARARSSRSSTATSPASSPIDDEVAYRRFRIAPQPGGGITWAEAAHDSPVRPDRVVLADRPATRSGLTVTVPPGTTADVVLPDGTNVTQGPGTLEHTCPAS